MKKMLVLFVFMLLVTGCKGGESDYGYIGGKTKLSQKIINVIDENCKQEGSCTFSINDIADFKWDKMVVFDVGSERSDISNALGVEYKEPIDLMSGMVFVYNNEIVYNEMFHEDPDKPNGFAFDFDNVQRKNIWSFTPNNSNVEGIKSDIDGKYYYGIEPVDYGYIGGNIKLSQKIIKVIDDHCKQDGSCTFSINDMTDFKWDKMVVYNSGSDNAEISKALGLYYEYSVDSVSGIVFVYDKKIVYNEMFPDDLKKPDKFWFYVDLKPGMPNLWSITPNDSVIEGSRSEYNGEYYYQIKPANAAQ